MNRCVNSYEGAGAKDKNAPRERQGTEAERIRAAERYLSEYRTAYRMLRAGMSGICRDAYGMMGEDFGGRPSRLLAAAHGVIGEDDRMWEDKLTSIRATVLAVEEPNEKIFLFQHYIRGNTVETCAEILDISVRTAFRLKKRALLTISEMI